MKFRSTAVLAATLATAPAFADFLSTVTLSMSGIAGEGAYNMSSNTWRVDFYSDADLSQSGLNADFGNWMLVVTGTNGMTWKTTSAETVGGSYQNVSGARIFTVTLAEGSPIGGTGDLSPAPAVLSLRYTTRKIAGSWQNMQGALTYSGDAATATAQRGMLVVGAADGTSFISGYFGTTVPAPGAAALIGLSGLIVSRRRNA